MKIPILIAIVLILFSNSVQLPAFARPTHLHPTTEQAQTSPWENEIFYQIFTRSFYDSNGDSVGDFVGIAQKLDYLKDLGVTGIWITPIFKSRTYHNYFADSFDSTDSKFGSNADFINLVKTVHDKGMKIFIDMETQYVTDLHPWYLAAKGNPSSPYAGYIRFKDSAATVPDIWHESNSYNGGKLPVINLNLLNPVVLNEQERIYSYWTDPNRDGKFDDGVDGFRIDHMMDDLDNKGQNNHLDSLFWTPLFNHLRSINPNVYILAEQSDWGYGADQLTKGSADAAFTIPLRFDLTAWNKSKILNDINSAMKATPLGKCQFTVIENHDVNRYATAVNNDPLKLRIGAMMDITLKGVPCLYYGQEIGMQGKKGKGFNDGNDIPLREAFRWYKTISGNGMALWYANSGPWWTDSSSHINDGNSLEEQKSDPNSLWQYYKKLIALRKTNPALRIGDETVLPVSNDSVLSYSRFYHDPSEEQTIVVIVNLQSTPVTTSIDLSSIHVEGEEEPLRNLMGDRKLEHLSHKNASSYSIDLAGYEVLLLELGDD